MNNKKQLLSTRQVLFCVALQWTGIWGQAVIWPWDEGNGSLEEKQIGRSQCIWCCLLLSFVFWSFRDCRVTVFCIHLCWDKSRRQMMFVLSSFFKRSCIFHLVTLLKLLRRVFLHDWHRCICPGMFQGNILLSKSQKNVLMTLDFHCTGVLSGFCWCVCMGTDPGRGHQKTFWEQLAVLWSGLKPPRLCSVFRMQVVQQLREAEPARSMPVPSARAAVPHLCYFSIPEGEIKDTVDGVCPLSLPVSLPWMMCAQTVYTREQRKPGHEHWCVALGFLTREQVEPPRQVGQPQVPCYHRTDTGLIICLEYAGDYCPCKMLLPMHIA